MDEPTTSVEADKEKKEKQENEIKTEPKEIKEEVKEAHESSEPSASCDGQAKLLEKLQSEGLLTPREVVSRPQTKEKEANKKQRVIKTETAEGAEEVAPKKAKRKRASAETEDNKEEGAEGEEKKKRKRERSQAASVVCEYIHTQGSELQCKQRAILGYHFCIRHILQDPEAPYQQCAHQRRPKNKNDTVTRCTNAIKKDSNETFCSTHLIMQGLKEVKKKQPTNTESTSGRSTPHDGGDVSSPGQHTQTATSPAINAVSSPIRAEFSEQPYVPPVVQIKKEQLPLGQQPLPVLIPSIKREDSHLLRALSTPFGPSPSGPPPFLAAMRPDHMLRTVLEQKPEPQKLLPQQTITQNIAPSISSLAPVHTELNQVHSAASAVPPPQPPSPSLSGPLPPRELLSRMTPTQKAVFDKFLRTRKQRPISPSPPRPALIHRFIPQRIVGGRPRKLSADHVARVDRILRRISPQARQAWAMSVTNRTGLRMVAHRGPFPLTAVEKVNPVLANRLSHLARKRVPRVTIRSCHAFNNIRLPATAPPIRPRSPSSDEDEAEFADGVRVIKLHSKRQMRKMVGPYRDIPVVSQMCDKLEDADFDDTDLFPLGLEPSDDELDDMPGSAGSAGLAHPIGMSLMGEYKDPHTELYLLRKQLRLERHQLLKTAQLNAPIMTSAKLFPLSTGAALRQRSEPMPVPPEMLITTLRRCCQVENKQRCDRACLPTANQCSLHVLYNVDQKLYQFCSHSFCRRPVLSVDAYLWDGKCRLHRESRLEKYGEYPVYDDMELPQARASSLISSKSGESEDEDETDIDEVLEGHRDEFDDEDDVSVGSP